MKLFSRASRQSVAFGVAASALLLISAACSRGTNDAQIIGEVSTRIQRDAQVPNKNIAITSNKGVVTLSGSANSEAERLAASNDASQVEGVKTVINNLAVAQPALPQQAAVEQPKPVDTPTEAKLIEPPVRQSSKKPSPYHAKQSASSVNDKSGPAKSSASSSSDSAQDSAPVSNTGIINTTPMPASTTTAANNAASGKSDAILIPPPPLPVKMITIDSGTPISVRLVDTVDSNRN